MKPSERCYAFIKNEEKCVLHPYLDSAGIPTIGWGSTMYSNGKKVTMADPPISQTYADALLKWEVENKTASISGALKNIVLNQNQYDAIVSFVYNIGVGGFLDSTVLRRMKTNPDDPTIIDAFLMWNKITKNGAKVESKGLTARRKREAAFYFTPMT